MIEAKSSRIIFVVKPFQSSPLRLALKDKCILDIPRWEMAFQVNGMVVTYLQNSESNPEEWETDLHNQC